MRVAIVDYGMGNLGSVMRTLAELAVEPFIAAAPETLETADRIILPGVGSFADGMKQLRERGWVDALRAQATNEGKPILGICLGMQLLASRGTEHGDTLGLELIPGEVLRLDVMGCALRVPHVGWNAVSFCCESPPLFSDIPAETDFYFVHSFGFQPRRPENLSAYAEYGIRVPAAVQSDHVFGTQFHPEKSSKAGRRLLRNFLDYRRC